MSELPLRFWYEYLLNPLSLTFMLNIKKMLSYTSKWWWHYTDTKYEVAEEAAF